MNNNDNPATRADVEEIVTKAVGGATSQILTAVGEQFDIVNYRIDEVENSLSDQISHLDRKLDTYSKDFETRISNLEKA